MDRNQISQPDEGFFEPQPDAQLDLDALPEHISSYLEALRILPVAQQQNLIMSLLDNLPTKSVAQVVKSIYPRLYINFVQRLPLEIVLKIVKMLDLQSVLMFGQTCRGWYHVSLDNGLWKDLYRMEGWSANMAQLARMEKWANSSQLKVGQIDYRFSSQNENDPDRDAEMVDRDATVVEDATLVNSEPEDDFQEYIERPKVPDPTEKLPRLQLFNFLGNNDSFTISWKYLYVMRLRLEQNWARGTCTYLQFPNPRDLSTKHSECVYTVQFNHQYLVSGSRDRSIRIWDMKTQKLARSPLVGHSGSVLCVQFDPSPEEDIIVSGSSDSNVIVWRFSTGEILHHLTDAHTDSVLNLKFNKEVLVTCSKDHTIKVFNRRALSYGDTGYGHSNSEATNYMNTMVLKYGYAKGPADYMPIRPPYSLICLLAGHTAPVNAVQIHGTEIVSASGDRLIKLWNWEKGTCTVTVQGHGKGIACVEYDGRRIVSGSSDKNIKIFDSRTGAVVASLDGHKMLVRTLQAGFADLPTSVEDDELEAKLVDQSFDQAVAEGRVNDPSRPHTRSHRLNIPGSRLPDHVLSRGAKLPPGGGGGPHARIVTGSYDQTIIIWRRTRGDIWKPSQTLRQEDALVNANIMKAQEYIHPESRLHLRSCTAWIDLVGSIVNTQTITQAVTSHPELLVLSNMFRTAIAQAHDDVRVVVTQQWDNVKQQYSEAVAQWDESNGASAVVANTPTETEGEGFEFEPGLGPPVLTEQMDRELDTAPARIFKLQFDSTRLLACTHKSIIVGWDFAAGDKELMALRRVFEPIA